MRQPRKLRVGPEVDQSFGIASCERPAMEAVIWAICAPAEMNPVSLFQLVSGPMGGNSQNLGRLHPKTGNIQR